ncbi:hypothetical protein C5966_00105 [Cronobacter sakazakii]|nr:hypothetical protein FZH99_20405 [Cronobacter sakazakii]KAB0899699.1 hypothetical protein FZI07_01490 [Cronobacter sakazakii]KAB0900011.1 hypothetical protein FZI05_21175 [Cronobacter sakazakii]KAB0903228.1 hypothetical protein FZI55_20105 [Cronobacter sakazakii]KAB0911429.1 hypothetical protein FZI08_20235 [Cronobacter sakazakii]
METATLCAEKSGISVTEEAAFAEPEAAIIAKTISFLFIYYSIKFLRTLKMRVKNIPVDIGIQPTLQMTLKYGRFGKKSLKFLE